MSSSTRTIVAIAVVVGLAVAFWALLLAPKRDKADELSTQTTRLSAETATEEGRAIEGEEAKTEFPREYQQLVLLGKSVPGDAATPSLLVQLNAAGAFSETVFQSIVTAGEESSETATPAVPAGSAPIPPTEAAAALAPIGATVGPAGLLAMPYKLEFDGQFFDVAEFIQRIDSLVKTKDGVLVADGRLITIDGFTMKPLQSEGGYTPRLETNFSVTTYVTPPGQGLTAGATAAGPTTTPNLP